MSHPTVFTIGHSTHSTDRFLSLLRLHGITALGDVRSTPYSRTNPQFNRETLKQSLADAGIVYVYLGRELGARPEDPSCYENGKVQFDRLARTDLFRAGLARVQEGLAKFHLVLMCAEKEPLECHRTILVAYNLAAAGIDIQHIHADGSLEAHAALSERLARQFALPESDMFRTHADILNDAYKLQAERIAFTGP